MLYVHCPPLGRRSILKNRERLLRTASPGRSLPWQRLEDTVTKGRRVIIASNVRSPVHGQTCPVNPQVGRAGTLLLTSCSILELQRHP